MIDDWLVDFNVTLSYHLINGHFHVTYTYMCFFYKFWRHEICIVCFRHRLHSPKAQFFIGGMKLSVVDMMTEFQVEMLPLIIAQYANGPIH